MAEVLELSVKSNIKSVTKDTEDYGKSVGSAEDKLKSIRYIQYSNDKSEYCF